MYIVYLGSDKIRIVDSKVSFGKVVVNSLYSAITPNDYLDNPNEKTFADFSNVIAQGLTEIGGRGKKVQVVLENSTITLIEKELPTISSEIKVINLIKNEIFSDPRLAESNILDYFEVERYVKNEQVKKEVNEKWAEFLGQKPGSSSANKKNSKKSKSNNENKEVDDYKETKVKTSRIFFTYISKIIATQLEKFFKDLGYKLVGIDVYQNVIRKLVDKQLHDKKNANMPKTFLLVEYKEDAITTFLFKDGKFAYTFRKSLMLSLTEMQTSYAFVSELAETIRESLQFFKAKYQDIDLEEIYITGVLEGFDQWKDIIASRVSYDIKMLSKPEYILNVNDLEFNEFSGALSGFIKA